MSIGRALEDCSTCYDCEPEIFSVVEVESYVYVLTSPMASEIEYTDISFVVLSFRPHNFQSL